MAETLEAWEVALAGRGYRKSLHGRSKFAVALYQRDVSITGSGGLFFNFDRHDFEDDIHPELPPRISLSGWMQVEREDGRCVNVEQFSFNPAELLERLDVIEKEWLAVVDLAPVVADQRITP